LTRLKLGRSLGIIRKTLMTKSKEENIILNNKSKPPKLASLNHLLNVVKSESKKERRRTNRRKIEANLIVEYDSPMVHN
jgi:hypothetical protein